jgi:uncharacterized membrane protein YfhO
MIAFSRPYFNGYKATLNGRAIAVSSERGFFPVVELPGGSHGKLVLKYRPAWLIYGGALAVVCAVIVLVAGLVGLRHQPMTNDEWCRSRNSSFGNSPAEP